MEFRQSEDIWHRPVTSSSWRAYSSSSALVMLSLASESKSACGDEDAKEVEEGSPVGNPQYVHVAVLVVFTS
jgi:hypothetical protein